MACRAGHAAMSVAAGSLSIGAIGRNGAAQAGRRIERLDPALDEIISDSEPIVDLATDLGDTAYVEGPAATSCFAARTSSGGNMRPGSGSRSSRRIPCGQRDRPRSTGPAYGLRCGDAPGHARGTRPQHDRHRERLPGPATQLSKRHRGQIRRRNLFHRSTLTLLVNDFLTPNGIASRRMRACSTSTTRRAAISAPSMLPRTARSRARRTGFLPT
jgi:hypothetical protein